jgi:hypothetical protein
MTFVAYGIPYFNRLPGSLVAGNIPRLASNHNRSVLEEAVPSPTDVSPGNPGIVKQRFNVPVSIEHNDVLITIRGDDSSYVADVVSWFGGAERRLLHHHAVQPGGAGPVQAVRNRPERQRPRTLHHRDPAAELPRHYLVQPRRHRAFPLIELT